MIDFIIIFNAFLLAAQVALSFAATLALLFARRKHTQHNYISGLVSALWAGSMMAYGVGSIINWPQALDGASVVEVALCGLSAGLAIYSGGSIFKVGRLCRKFCCVPK